MSELLFSDMKATLAKNKHKPSYDFSKLSNSFSNPELWEDTCKSRESEPKSTVSSRKFPLAFKHPIFILMMKLTRFALQPLTQNQSRKQTLVQVQIQFPLEALLKALILSKTPLGASVVIGLRAHNALYCKTAEHVAIAQINLCGK